MKGCSINIYSYCDEKQLLRRCRLFCSSPVQHRRFSAMRHISAVHKLFSCHKIAHIQTWTDAFSSTNSRIWEAEDVINFCCCRRREFMTFWNCILWTCFKCKMCFHKWKSLMSFKFNYYPERENFCAAFKLENWSFCEFYNQITSSRVLLTCYLTHERVLRNPQDLFHLQTKANITIDDGKKKINMQISFKKKKRSEWKTKLVSCKSLKSSLSKKYITAQFFNIEHSRERFLR